MFVVFDVEDLVVWECGVLSFFVGEMDFFRYVDEEVLVRMIDDYFNVLDVKFVCV